MHITVKETSTNNTNVITLKHSSFLKLSKWIRVIKIIVENVIISKLFNLNLYYTCLRLGFVPILMYSCLIVTLDLFFIS